ncbi:YchJ family protein [Pseudobacteriovorax antillogorgiicola]|uniref:UPF0225 protein SAMN06296036_1227 n=1 Tax=Pseudobacteriovorax antillogorgiicola TaxID=1513793 RepID=A0A1Y6CGJ7_9BACT|nr:YchJ family protein [Pseudobacteriovorax antillogorgiicola]TCS46912.1 SEC-C motif-containing protein [Pseudobacteriovorax antillogorgiicola]SMF64122.1 SEC-C motif-containing protein [Pseudobacteriovorax antillogorgiicola]
MTETTCPCGSELNYSQCCGPFIEGQSKAPTPEALMRSRYTAFTLAKNDYLQLTWHPDTRPDELDDEPSDWIGLEIVSSETKEDSGQVEFIARLIHDGKLETLHEISEFELMGDQWVYVEGEFVNDGNHIKKIAKNEPCPCLSGKKFKRCHGAS